MITMRSCAEESQTHHRSQGCKLRRLCSRNSERSRESMEKSGKRRVSGTFAMTEPQCSPQMPLSQTAQLVLWTLGPNILWVRQDQVTSSPSDVTCPLDSSVPTFVHASPRKNHPAAVRVKATPRKNPGPVVWCCLCVCVSKDIQDCKTMRNFPDPEAARLCNSVTLAVKNDLVSP